LQAEHERAALLPDVERRHTLDAELRAEQRPGARKDVVRRHRRKKDVIDVLRAQPRGLERTLARLDREIARALSFAGVMPLLDPRALEDPLVGGVHDARQTLVRDGLAGYEMSRSDDFESHERSPNSSGRAKRRRNFTDAALTRRISRK